jgi:hypothetical protein
VTFRETVAERRTVPVALNLPQLSALLAQEGGDPRDPDLHRARQKLEAAHARRSRAVSRAAGQRA